MPTIRLTDQAYSALRGATAPGHEFASTGQQQPDGTWLVPFSPEVHTRLSERCLPGESYSQTIIRVLALANHGSN